MSGHRPYSFIEAQTDHYIFRRVIGWSSLGFYPYRGFCPAMQIVELAIYTDHPWVPYFVIDVPFVKLDLTLLPDYRNMSMEITIV